MVPGARLAPKITAKDAGNKRARCEHLQYQTQQMQLYLLSAPAMSKRSSEPLIDSMSIDQYWGPFFVIDSAPNSSASASMSRLSHLQIER